jgi:hypothetical protein
LNPSDKRDDSKIPWINLPWDAMQEVGEVIRYGTKRHGPRNWEIRDPKDADFVSAMLRHVIAYAQGLRIDKESGRHHLAHAVANALFVIHHESRVEKSIKEQPQVMIDAHGKKWIPHEKLMEWQIWLSKNANLIDDGK